MRLIYHPDAEAELIGAARFYEARVPQLGAQFLDAVDRAVSLILEAPDRWRILEADVRRYPCRDSHILSTIGFLQRNYASWRSHTTAVIQTIGALVCPDAMVVVRRMTKSRMVVILARCIAVLLLLQGVVGLVLPDTFTGVVRFMQTPPVIYVAAVLRIAIGGVLLAAASTSRLPMFLRIFGGLVLLGGLLTPVWGTHFAAVILGWWSSQGSALVRLFATSSLVLGFMVGYAVLPGAGNAKRG